MSDQPIGITFNETMKGPFAMNHQDPEAGERAGRQAGTELSLRATIDIRDLDRFIRDRDHTGSISGHIDFAPLGMGLPFSSGIFNLFCPGPDPAVKFMVYEAAFSAGGRDYYLAGHKEI